MEYLFPLSLLFIGLAIACAIVALTSSNKLTKNRFGALAHGFVAMQILVSILGIQAGWEMILLLALFAASQVAAAVLYIRDARKVIREQASKQ